MNSLLGAALEYAAKGWPIFPCTVDKEPFTENGVLDATTDPAIIKGWWAKWPMANIGLDVGGVHMMVYDFDPGHDMAGLKANVGDIPQTMLKAKTPRGGEHWYYALAEGEIVANSASKIANHVDVRSFHGYVLLPPSRTVNGEYTWESQGKPAFRTDEMVRTANIAKEKDKDRDNWIVDPDLPHNIAKAIQWLETEAKPAIMGQGGDHMAYKTAAMMKSYALSQEKACEVMWEHWNPKCIPPWSADEYEHFEAKVTHAYRYNTSPPGNQTSDYRSAKVRSLLNRVHQPPPTGRERIIGRYRFTDFQAMEHIKDPTWLIKDILPAGAYAMMYAPPESFKSFVALDFAYTVATGFPMNTNFIACDSGPVIYAVGEGRSGMNRRAKSWRAAHWGGEDHPNFAMVDPVPAINDDAVMQDFIEGCRWLYPDQPIKMVVIDTLGRAMQGADENSQKDASRFTALVEALQLELGGPTVLVLHHTGVDGTRERGSTVFNGDVDTMLRLDRPDAHGMHAYLHVTKQKEADKPEKPIALKFVKEGDSLVCVPPSYGMTREQAKERQDNEQLSREQKSTREIFEAETIAKKVDEAVEYILSNTPGKEWSGRALSVAVNAVDGMANLKPDTLRKNWIEGKLRQTEGTVTRRCFIPSTLKYMWRKPKG